MGSELAVLIFAPGLAIGSFLNVVASRIPARRSISAPRSACPTCATTIAWYDNIPIVSYLLLHGHCRSCSARIARRYPAVELTTALLISACVLRFGVKPEAAVAAFFCATLVALTVTDLEHRIIPNRIVLPAAIVVLAAQTALRLTPAYAIAAAAGALFFLVTALIYPAGMGMGDVKLVLLLGAMLGSTLPVCLMIGLVSALVPAVVMVARHGQKARTMGIPLAPFLALGALVALFAGHELLHLYLNLR